MGRPRTEPCGTWAAHQRHMRHHEEPCEPCKAAALQYRREAWEREKAKIAAARDRAERFPVLTTRVLAVWSAHKEGDLVLG